jgi:hypothetical protein
MQGRILFGCFLLSLGLAAVAESNPPAKPVSVRLMVSEVQAGATQAQQYCTLVFADRHFHHERASLHHGKDLERKVYEGEFSESDWNELAGILDSKDFRELNVPRGVAPLIMQDSHVYTISVARETNFQNMEFLDNKSRKPYELQLKPLLVWWTSFRGGHKTESKVTPDARCLLNSEHAVFSQ